jgi:hypothetical protein
LRICLSCPLHGVGNLVGVAPLGRRFASHPDLQGLRRWVLGTRDAHGLYQKFGFTPLKRPEIFMEIVNPDVYRAAKQR